jgi:hypothetical protein
MPRRQGSKPIYKMKVDRDVQVKMRDGKSLCVDVFQPDADGRFPALIALSPYGKMKQSLPISPLPPEAPLYNPSIEAGDPNFLASRGYVHIIGDVRGTGKSEGDYLGWMSKKEAEDGYDLVEWAAKQPWCDGNVGMTGISYYGTIQLMVAAEQPPHLKAIMPWNAPADFYREATYHGGIMQMFFHFLYSQHIHGNCVSVMAEKTAANELRDLTKRIMEDSDIRMYPEIYSIVDNPRVCPNFFDVIVNPVDGPFYWERSPYKSFDRIKIPFYVSSGWWAYAHMHLVGTFTSYLGINAPKKLLISGPSVLPCPLPREYNEGLLAWYDYWLKGIDTGIMTEPPIQLFIMGPNKFRFENEWPLARTRWTKFYLRNWERLSPEAEEANANPDCFVQKPPSETATVQSLKYSTPPLEQDTEVTGPLALYLHAAIDQTDTNWIVYLKDVNEQGLVTELSKGFLKASHRRLDEEKSKPWQPYHPHTNPEPVTPGRIYEYAISLAPTAYVFKARHRIRLEITSMDHPRSSVAPITVGQYHLPYHLCSSKTTLHRIHFDREHSSHLLLPIIPP